MLLRQDKLTTGANYLHPGQHNPLEIPFLPKSFTAWPWSYPSFVAVGVVLLHLSFLFLKWIERKQVQLHTA